MKTCSICGAWFTGSTDICPVHYRRLWLRWHQDDQWGLKFLLKRKTELQRAGIC